MKTFVGFGFSVQTPFNGGKHTLPSGEFELLKSVWPGKVTETSISFDGDARSTECRCAIELMASLGRTPQLYVYPEFPSDYGGPRFRISSLRAYDAGDLGAIEFIILRPKDKLADEEIYRLPDGTHEKYVNGKRISKRVAFGFAGPFNWACKASVRAELEAEGFVGLAFEEMPQKPVSKPHELIFRLVSTLALPPVLNPLYNEDGDLCRGDFSRGCVPDNSIVSGLPIYYDEVDIRAMEPFDCAWTAEAFGGVHWRNRSFVVSKRFLEYCRNRGWNCDFVPVILRPDGDAPPLEPLFPWLEGDAT